MAEYIDKEAFKKSVEESYCKPCKAEGKDHNWCLCRACWVDGMLDEVGCFQTADVTPVVHGHWIMNEDDELYCSVCGDIASLDSGEYFCRDKIRFDDSFYCPNCGAKMDGSSNEE